MIRELLNITYESLGTMDRMFYNCRNFKYLNLYSLTEKVQSISEIFEGASNDFIFCIKENKDILRIFKEIYKRNDTKPDCKESCYVIGNERPFNNKKKICCPEFLFEDNCYNYFPPRTAANELRVCEFLPWIYFNYIQDGCIDIIPDGYFLIDIESKKIGKCHEKCKTCIRGQTDSKDICLSCNENFP